eukprot:852734-Pelagomonas_calceolata.AAC.3
MLAWPTWSPSVLLEPYGGFAILHAWAPSLPQALSGVLPVIPAAEVDKFKCLNPLLTSGVDVSKLEAAAAASGKAAAVKAVARSDRTVLVKNLPYSARCAGHGLMLGLGLLVFCLC